MLFNRRDLRESREGSVATFLILVLREIWQRHLVVSRGFRIVDFKPSQIMRGGGGERAVSTCRAMGLVSDIAITRMGIMQRMTRGLPRSDDESLSPRWKAFSRSI